MSLQNNSKRKQVVQKEKIKLPDIIIECVEDLYTLYLYVFELNRDDIWQLPLTSVQMIAEKKTAIENWTNYENEKAGGK